MENNKFKSGFVAVMGRPNVGKSSLVNALVGQKIAAVTPRPQTTRKRQMGILNLESAQVIFIDTPGVHNSRNKLGEYMNTEALDTLAECDLVLVVVDGSLPPDDEDRLLANEIASKLLSMPMILAVNKVDLDKSSNFEENKELFAGMWSQADLICVSAQVGSGLGQLTNMILERLGEGVRFFPEDQVTDLYERDIAADLIREAALIHLRDEIPHGIAVRIDQFTEREETGAYIEATVLVEKESHKPIVIGQKGEMMKRIGSTARKEIESVSGRKVFLRMRVKVRKNWRDDESVVRKLF